MDDSNKKYDASIVKEEIIIKLDIMKKRVQYKVKFLIGHEGENYLRFYNRLIRFYANFETRFNIRKGDVFEVNFGYECGHEIHGDHFVVAITSSNPNNQLVTVVPLKSFKPSKPLNPASDINLGIIRGINGGNQSIAVVNQLKTIDKRRMFNGPVLDDLNKLIGDSDVEDYSLITVQNKRIFRLTNEQFTQLVQAVRDFISCGYIKHSEVKTSR